MLYNQLSSSVSANAMIIMGPRNQLGAESLGDGPELHHDRRPHCRPQNWVEGVFSYLSRPLPCQLLQRGSVAYPWSRPCCMMDKRCQCSTDRRWQGNAYAFEPYNLGPNTQCLESRPVEPHEHNKKDINIKI